MRVAALGDDPVVLSQVETAGRVARVDADRLVRRALERPASRYIGVVIQIAVELAPELHQLAGCGIGQPIGALLEIVSGFGSRRRGSRSMAPRLICVDAEKFGVRLPV